MSTDLDYSPLRLATKFSLWAWALYWPGGGLLLMFGGLPLPGVLLTIGSLLTFIFLMFFGQLGIEDSKNRLQLFLERPLYLVGALFLALLMVPFIGAMAMVGIHAFGFLLFGGTSFLVFRIIQFARKEEGNLATQKVDQLLIAASIGALASFIMAMDSIFYMFGAAFVTGNAGVLVVNWAAITYPILVLLGSRGILAPLRRKHVDPVTTPEVPAALADAE